MSLDLKAIGTLKLRAYLGYNGGGGRDSVRVRLSYGQRANKVAWASVFLWRLVLGHEWRQAI